MSLTRYSELDDHEKLYEQAATPRASWVARPISASPGKVTVSATRSEIRDGRVVFVEDCPLSVYKSYPISISSERGGPTAPHASEFSLRAIVVEPENSKKMAAFSGCTVAISIAPSTAAWCELAPFKTRHDDRTLRYPTLETSVLRFPGGCEVRLDGHLRDAVTEKTRPTRYTAILLEPFRVAEGVASGRRHRGSASPSSDSKKSWAELWHWGVVRDYEKTFDCLAHDEELSRFAENVREEDFLLDWYRAHPQIVTHSPSGKPNEELLIPAALRSEEFVRATLNDAVRCALAGPVDFDAYRSDVARRVQAGRRAGDSETQTPLVYPLVQNIYADWLDSAARADWTWHRLLASKHGSSHAAVRRRVANRMFEKSLHACRERLSKLDNETFAQEAIRILNAAWNPEKDRTAESGSDADAEDDEDDAGLPSAEDDRAKFQEALEAVALTDCLRRRLRAWAEAPATSAHVRELLHYHLDKG